MSSEHEIDDGGPAFPVADSHYPNGQVQYGASGMSLRDYFAGLSMQATLAGCRDRDATGLADIDHEIVAIDSYIQADAMIAARKAGAK